MLMTKMMQINTAMTHPMSFKNNRLFSASSVGLEIWNAIKVIKKMTIWAFSLQVVNNHTTCSGGSCIDPIKIKIVPLTSFIASDECGTF